MIKSIGKLRGTNNIIVSNYKCFTKDFITPFGITSLYLVSPCTIYLARSIELFNEKPTIAKGSKMAIIIFSQYKTLLQFRQIVFDILPYPILH